MSVAIHKDKFFRARDRDVNRIDYPAAVNGDLRLIPDGDAYEALAEDYDYMLKNRLFFADAPPFGRLMAGCRELEIKGRRGPP